METRKKRHPSLKQLENMGISQENVRSSSQSGIRVSSPSTTSSTLPEGLESPQPASAYETSPANNISTFHDVLTIKMNHGPARTALFTPTEATIGDQCSPTTTAPVPELPTSPPETLSRSASEEQEAYSAASRPSRKRQQTAKAQEVARADKKLARVFESQTQRSNHDSSTFTPEASTSPSIDDSQVKHQGLAQNCSSPSATNKDNISPSSQTSISSSSNRSVRGRDIDVSGGQSLDRLTSPSTRNSSAEYIPAQIQAQGPTHSVVKSTRLARNLTNPTESSPLSHLQRNELASGLIEGQISSSTLESRNKGPSQSRVKGRRGTTHSILDEQAHVNQSESEADNTMLQASLRSSGRRKKPQTAVKADTTTKGRREAKQQGRSERDAPLRTESRGLLVSSGSEQSIPKASSSHGQMSSQRTDEQCDLSCLEPSDLLYAMAEIIAAEDNDEDDDIDDTQAKEDEERASRMLRSYCRCPPGKSSKEKKTPSKLRLKVGQKSRDAESTRLERETRR